jgi:hypothetical protein
MAVSWNMTPCSVMDGYRVSKERASSSSECFTALKMEKILLSESSLNLYRIKSYHIAEDKA